MSELKTTDSKPSARHIYAGRIVSTVLSLTLTVFVLPGVALAEGANDTQGFLYGKVTMRSDTIYEGRLRWNGDEEAFWGDLFNGTKEDRPYLDEISDRARRRDRDGIRILGIRIGSFDSYSSDRSFVVRFGDIKKIETHRRDAVLTMKGGEVIEIDGSSTNDIGEKLYVWDHEIGQVKLDWDNVDVIEFLPTPANIEVSVTRLHGKVKTEEGDFEGYIQWDKQECLSTDELDGDSRDGGMSIEMGKIESIERLSSRTSRVTLWSGRDFDLRGSNDVNSDNRGIFVEDPRYGRVMVKWDAFERLDFTPAGPSGPSYNSFEPGRPIQGTVTETNGKTHSGRIVYDIDEANSWEILNGDQRDLEFNIPFELVKSVEPRDRDSSRVTLKGGEELVLEDVADVDDGNDGVLVITSSDKSVYIAWGDIERIDFEG